MSFYDKFKKEQDKQNQTENVIEQDEIQQQSTVEVTAEQAEERDSLPGVNDDGRESKGGKNAKMAIFGVVAIIAMLAGAGWSATRWQEMRKAEKAKETELQAQEQKGKIETASLDINADKENIKNSQLSELTPPASAEEETAENTAPQNIVEPTPAPTPVVAPQPQYNNYNDGGMVAGRDYAPPAPIEQPQAQPINKITDEDEEVETVEIIETAPTPVLVDIYSERTALAQPQRDETGLARTMKSSTLADGSASLKGDKSMLLMRGTTIPCVMKTKIDSTYQGFTTCQVAKDVYSANGKVLLIERGSTVFGEQNVQITQGKARVAVLWSKIETPKGVSISLDSPATGQLGEMGIGAKVNNHYGKRFGGAILLSIIQDGFSALSTHLEKDKENGDGSTTVSNTTSTAEGMAEEILKNTINIPPTATVNQGAMINIMVVRDIDFGGIYKLKRR